MRVWWEATGGTQGCASLMVSRGGDQGRLLGLRWQL